MIWKTSFVVVIAVLVCIYLSQENRDWEADIKGQNVLVTGASSGIGEQIAYLYARMGANVFITARRKDRLKEVIEECRRLGSDDALFGFYPADMSQYKLSTPQVIQAASKLFDGRIDHLILNHAKMQNFEKWEGTEEQLKFIEEVLSVNVMSYIHLTSHALPHLRQSPQARIGVVSSTCGKLDFPFLGSYATSKFALDAFFSSLRKEFTVAKDNITVTLHILGFIDTDSAIVIMDRLADTLHVDYKQLSEVFPPAKTNDTALAMIKATALGKRELYYGAGVVGRAIMPYLPALRHLSPWLLDAMTPILEDV